MHTVIPIPDLITERMLVLYRLMRSAIYGHFYYHGLTLIPAWISDYIHYKVWDAIIYLFLNFNGATVEV